jgi:peptidoglycan/LPS O-acetylase OafA/YrhL
MMGALPGEGTTPRVPPSNHRFELFESLRAIAALSVLLHHTGGWSNVNLFAWYGAFTSKLHLGVTLFFLISGFLLYRPHAVQMLGGPAAPPTGDYALRRAFRILPAYWVALTVLSVWPGLRGVFTKDWWVYYGLLQSYRPEWSLRGIGVAWSLSVEIAFYVLLPLVAVVLSWAGRRLDLRDRMRLQLLAFAALGVGSLLFRAAIQDARAWGLTLPAHSLGFAAGMSTAVVSAWSERRESEWRATRWITAHSGWCWALAAVLFSAMSLSPAFPRPFSDAPQSTFAYTAESLIGTVIASLVMLPAVFGEHAGGLPRRVLRSRALSWVGKISYGVFLWHLPLLETLQTRFFSQLSPAPAFVSLALLILPLALGIGWLSWRWIELPALRVARSLGGRGTLAAAAVGELGSAPRASA